MEVQEGIYNQVVDKIHERTDLVKGAIASRFKKTKPFRAEPIDNRELLFQYEQLCSDVNAPILMQTLIQRHGQETVNLWVGDMESMKQRLAKKENKDG